MDTRPEDIEEGMEFWPEYVDSAFRTFYYGGQHERGVEAFAKRWSGLDLEAFLRALKSGTIREKAIALLAFGYNGAPQAQDILLPFLESSEPMERWASALALGEMKDEHALPVLIRLLDEFLPPQVNPLELEGGVYLYWHMKIAVLLGEWERSVLAPILRRALKRSWDIEQAETINFKNAWHPYQDELVYALGRIGAFGALAGISVPVSRLQMWMVMMCFGSFQARQSYGDLLTQIQINEALQKEVAQVLEQRFGLSEEERTHCIEHYAIEYFDRMVEDENAA